MEIIKRIDLVDANNNEISRKTIGIYRGKDAEGRKAYGWGVNDGNYWYEPTSLPHTSIKAALEDARLAFADECLRFYR